MEHLFDFKDFLNRTGINDPLKLSLLSEYSKAIYSENKKYNLTGHKTLDEIFENLIVGSLEPIKNFNVPRGTLFADIGTGSGIPGIPIAVKHTDCNGILFDSNLKKINFVNQAALILNINNIKGVYLRVEDACRSIEYCEKFDIVFTRAMSDLYTIAEIGSPLLKIGGYIFLYVNRTHVDLNNYQLEHLMKVGLSSEITSEEKKMLNNEITDGFILKKIKTTDPVYPRRMPVIKRMALK